MFSAGTAVMVSMALETSFSVPPDTENTSDSTTLIFLPLLMTFDRQIRSGPVAGLKKLILNSTVRMRNFRVTVMQTSQIPYSYFLAVSFL